MAVTQTTQLPEQPAGGSSRLIPLTGDGFTFPRSMYEVQALLAGDASAGNSDIQIDFDQRYTTLVVHVELVILGAAASQDYLLNLAMRLSSITAQVVGQTIQNSVSTLTPGIAWWDPPPLVPVESIQSTVANVNGDTTLLKVWSYNFDINALNTIPLSLMLAGLPRTALSSQNP